VDRVHGSQFYITYAPQPHLDRPASTVFGKVVSGMDVLRALTPRDPDAEEEPPPGDKILGIEIEES
jgi:cyclophilin family peptidyl-prolyl cis-trans isomerase